jgi:hypothetical protein
MTTAVRRASLWHPMRPALSSRTPTFLLATIAAFTAGVAFEQLCPRDAHAQAMSSLSTIYVPSDGLVFRTLDGRAIAKLSHDAHGGFLELYDDRQEGVARFSSGALGVPHSAARDPYVLDQEDPWRPAQMTRPEDVF